MTGRGLGGGEIENVTQHTADRRAGDMNDAEPIRVAHDYSQRSATTMVSPGRTGASSGTVLRTASFGTWRVTVTVLLNARGVKPPAIATAVSAVMLAT